MSLSILDPSLTAASLEEALEMIDTLKDAAFQPAPKVCTVCGDQSVFDDNTGYFHFLTGC